MDFPDLQTALTIFGIDFSVIGDYIVATLQGAFNLVLQIISMIFSFFIETLKSALDIVRYIFGFRS